jgi:hypothetical protein
MMSDKHNIIFKTLKTAAFTVVTPNYMAHARSLKKSFLQHNPDAEFFIGISGNESHCRKWMLTTVICQLA